MTTHTLIRQTRARISWLDQRGLPLPLCIALVTFCLLGIIGAVGRISNGDTVSPITAATPSLPIVVFATAQPQLPSPEPAAMVAVVAPPAVRYVVAFAEPNTSAVLGPIPQPAASALVARYGDGWYMTYHDGAPVWIRAAELGMQIADLAPERVIVVEAPQPQPVYSEPAEPLYEAANVAPALEQPTIPPPNAPATAPTVQPRTELAPMEQNSVTREWARQQWQAEHP